MMYSSTNVTVYIIINISSKCLPEKKIVRYVFLINGFNFPFDFFVSQVLAFLERPMIRCTIQSMLRRFFNHWIILEEILSIFFSILLLHSANKIIFPCSLF